MAPPDDDDPPAVDQKVKDLIDAATRAELERWFGLPSFDQAADAPAPAPSDEDPDVAAVRERRAAALAAIDPALVEAHRKRVEPDEARWTFQSNIELTVERPFGFFDAAMIERAVTIGEPREVEISEELRDDLKDCTPQALLRDLHRPELDFDKTFEIVDMAAEQRLDIVAEVELAMKTSWKLPELGGSPFREGRELMEELRAERKQPWTRILEALPNRRVSE